MPENGKVGCGLHQSLDPRHPRWRILGGLTSCLGDGAREYGIGTPSKGSAGVWGMGESPWSRLGGHFRESSSGSSWVLFREDEAGAQGLKKDL